MLIIDRPRVSFTLCKSLFIDRPYNKMTSIFVIWQNSILGKKNNCVV